MTKRPIGWQVILRLDDDRPLAPSVAHRRRAVRAIARLGQPFGVVAWCVADTHLHVEALTGEVEATELGRRLRLSLRWALDRGAPFAPTRLRPVNDHAHAKSLFHYILRQSSHHGALHDPFAEGSSLPDVLGARAIAPWLPALVREAFPRLTRAEVLANVDVPPALPPGLPDADTAAAAWALADLAGKDPTAVRARAALAAAMTCPISELATMLAVDARSARRLRAKAASATDVARLHRAASLRAALRAVEKATPMLAQEPSQAEYTYDFPAGARPGWQGDAAAEAR